MFIESSTPIDIWPQAKKLNDAETSLQQEIDEFQKKCDHNWEKIMAYDPHYSPRVDGRGVGRIVITEFHCPTCNLHKPIKGVPFKVCYQCGGNMKYDHQEQYGNSGHVSIHKCEDCGHEYDTT